MAIEIKVPAVLVPGSGVFVTESKYVKDSELDKTQAELNKDIGKIPALKAEVESLKTVVDEQLKAPTGTVQAAVNVSVTPIGQAGSPNNITSTNVQAALEELNQEKVSTQDISDMVVLGDAEGDATSYTLIHSDVATIAYYDEKGNSLSRLTSQIESLQELRSQIKSLQREIDLIKLKLSSLA